METVAWNVDDFSLLVATTCQGEGAAPRPFQLPRCRLVLFVSLLLLHELGSLMEWKPSEEKYIV